MVVNKVLVRFNRLALYNFHSKVAYQLYFNMCKDLKIQVVARLKVHSFPNFLI